MVTAEDSFGHSVIAMKWHTLEIIHPWFLTRFWGQNWPERTAVVGSVHHGRQRTLVGPYIGVKPQSSGPGSVHPRPYIRGGKTVKWLPTVGYFGPPFLNFEYLL